MTKTTVDVAIKRNAQSWAYLYIVLGFAVSIEGSIIGMLPFRWPTNVAIYLLSIAATAWLIIDSGWCQNKLIGIKNYYEEKER